MLSKKFFKFYIIEEQNNIKTRGVTQKYFGSKDKMQNHAYLKNQNLLSQLSHVKKLCSNTLTKQDSSKLDCLEKTLKIVRKQIKEFKMSEAQAFNIYQSIFNEVQTFQRQALLDFRLQRTDFEALINKQKIKEEGLSKIVFKHMDDKILTSASLSNANIDIQMQSFSLKSLCQKASTIMSSLPFSQTIQFTDQKAIGLITQICKNYHIIPYHNFTHAFSVFIFFYQCSQTESMGKWMESFELFFGLLACLSHDILHPGNNTLFEVKTKSNIAMAYHNCSIMEKMHASKIISLLDRQYISQNNPYAKLSKENKNRARRIIVRSIMATDMSKHYDYVRQISSTEAQQRKLSSQSPQDREYLIECLTHACDIGNPCMSYENYIYWANLICMEFNNQTKMEDMYGIQVTEFLKFNSLTYFYKNQLTFTSNVVAPLWQGLSQKYPQLQQYYKRIKQNIKKVNENLRRNSEPPLNVFEKYLNQRISKATR